MRDTTIHSNLKRKCKWCGNMVRINKNNVCDFIYYDGNTYHNICFTELCESRIKNKRVDISTKWTHIYEKIENIKKESYSHFMSSLDKEDIFNFIKDSYDITIIPTQIWNKLADINNGTFKGMFGQGIPTNHLLDMWIKKMDLLNDIYSKNVVKGVTMTTQQRISYDLSVLVNKYDSYLKWLEKKRINDIENETIKSDRLVSEINIFKLTNNNSDTDSDDISDLVDDIFG